MTSYTPNLKLLKKDPSTDGNDTFNLKTMLNDNWDKVDEEVGKKADKKTHIVYIEESQNWVVPDGVYEICVYAIGGGGGGGATYSGNGNYHYGAGGGGGAYADYRCLLVNPNQEIEIIIGAGGTGSTAGSSRIANSGGYTKFGEYLLVYGGTGGGPTDYGDGGCRGGGSVSEKVSYSDGVNGNAGMSGTTNSGIKDSTAALSATTTFPKPINTYRGAHCPITNELYGGAGGGGCIYDVGGADVTGGAGGAGGGGAGGGMTEDTRNGNNGTLYGAGGGGASSVEVGTGMSATYKYGSGGNGHDGVVIIAY